MRQTFKIARQTRPGLIVHWMGTRIAFSPIRHSSDGHTVDQSTVIPWDDSQHPFSEPEALGKWVSDEMNRAGLTPTRTIVSLPRQATMVRVIDVSHVDETEVAAAVALQVESLEHTLNRELAYDFLLHSGADGTSQFATLATCPKTVVEGITSALKPAGYDVDICCLGELSLSSLTAADASQPALVILANDVKLDVMLTVNQVSLAALATKMPPTTEQAVAVIEQMKGRLLAGLPHEAGITDVSDFLVVGTRSPALIAMLKTLPEVQVNTISNATSHDLLAKATVEDCIGLRKIGNLLHPTLPPNPWQEHKAAWLRRGSVLAGIALVLLAGLFWWHGRLNSELTQASIRLQNMQAVLTHAEPTVRKWEFLTSWRANAVGVSRQVVQLAKHLPNQERLYLTRLQIEDVPGGDEAVLRLDGSAREDNDIMKLNRTLLDADYELRPHGIEPSSRDPKFKSRFQIEASITDDDELN